MPKRKTTEEFIADAKKVHGDKYDYRESVYVNSVTKVKIFCMKCKKFFWQLPHDHLRGIGCPYCAGVAKDTTESFIEKARKVHGDKYDYSMVDYKKSSVKVKIICPIHGVFEQRPNAHLRGENCPRCALNATKTLVFGFGINDYDSPVKINGKHIESYSYWMYMLKRCHSEHSLQHEPTYRKCSICEEWKYFSNFKKWFDDPSNGYIKGLELDKDLLVRENKVYSPNTCCFLPQELNKLIMRHKSQRGKYMIGVYKRKNGKRFWAQINSPLKKTRLIGIYDTEYEAFLAYKSEKEKTIKLLAEEYYKKGLITKRAYDALYAYQVKEDD